MTERPAILIIDDEAAILDALRAMLRRQRTDWEMVFVRGGVLALAELANRTFDVVITDLRMPEVDGVTLLARLRDEFPAIQRIVLSGEGDSEARARAYGLAHQYLSKPCRGDRLRTTIADAIIAAAPRH